MLLRPNRFIVSSLGALDTRKRFCQFASYAVSTKVPDLRFHYRFVEPMPFIFSRTPVLADWKNTPSSFAPVVHNPTGGHRSTIIYWDVYWFFARGMLKLPTPPVYHVPRESVMTALAQTGSRGHHPHYGFLRLATPPPSDFSTRMLGESVCRGGARPDPEPVSHRIPEEFQFLFTKHQDHVSHKFGGPRCRGRFKSGASHGFCDTVKRRTNPLLAAVK